QPGQPLQAQVIVTDLEGRALAGRPVDLSLNRWNWEYGGKVSKQQVFASQVISANTSTTVSVPLEGGGTYQLSAKVLDSANRSNSSQITCWVAGGSQPPPTRQVELQKLTLVPNKRVYE